MATALSAAVWAIWYLPAANPSRNSVELPVSDPNVQTLLLEEALLGGDEERQVLNACENDDVERDPSCCRGGLGDAD
jgi:hypothetical protein